MKSSRYHFKSSQSGNVVLALFGALGLLAAVGYGYSTLIKGPAKGVNEITNRTASETEIFQAANILVSSARQNQAAEGDCDGDSYAEPLPWRAAAGAPAPGGGGLIPTGTPASTTDSWGTTLGYCAWDHGPISVSDNNAGCGGSAALRRQGGNVKTEEVIAVISAGPDRIFQTTCANYVNPSTPQITKAAGSDDMFVKFTYAEAFDAAGVAGGGLSNVDDSECTVANIGLMRYEQEVVQVCLDDGAGGAVWKEVGASADAVPGFIDKLDADPSTTYTSSTISFTGYFGTRTATVDNGGIIVVNGTPIGATAQVAVGDTVAIRGTSVATLSTPKTYILKVSSIDRPWVLQTRAATPATFSISPSAPTTMDVPGPGSPALGTQVTFTVTNTGEVTSGTINPAVLGNGTNFVVTGDNCSGTTRAAGASCTVFVRPRASADGAISSTLTISAGGAVSGVANLSGTASGFSCINVGGYCWYATATNVNCDTRCASLGGYNAATSTYAGGAGANANCLAVLTALGAGTGSVTDVSGMGMGTLGCFISSATRYRGTGVTSSSDAGSAVARACACNNGSSCVLDGQTVASGASRTFYSATSSANCAGISQTRNCADAVFDGSASYQYSTCTLPPITFTYIAQATSTTTNITVPATAQAGDFAVMYDIAADTDTDVTPSAVYALGSSEAETWINENTASASFAGRGVLSAKILAGGEAGSSKAGMAVSGATDIAHKIMFVYRPSRPIVSWQINDTGWAVFFVPSADFGAATPTFGVADQYIELTALWQLGSLPSWTTITPAPDAQATATRLRVSRKLTTTSYGRTWDPPYLTNGMYAYHWVSFN